MVFNGHYVSTERVQGTLPDIILNYKYYKQRKLCFLPHHNNHQHSRGIWFTNNSYT